MDQANHQNDNIKENAPAQDDVWSHLDSRRILAHTSHDLRTHLNTVLGLTSLAKAQSDDKEYIEYCLEKIDVSAHAVLDMVNDILYLTRLDSGDMLHTDRLEGQAIKLAFPGNYRLGSAPTVLANGGRGKRNTLKRGDAGISGRNTLDYAAFYGCFSYHSEPLLFLYFYIFMLS